MGNLSTVVIVGILLSFISISCATFNTRCGSSYPNGTYVSFSTLATNYFFNNSAPENVPAAYLPQGNVTIELQVCGPVVTRFPALCTNPNSAVNLIDPVAQTCTSLGDASVAGWLLNPSGNGVSLVYYHGDWLNHINSYSTRIYFECAESVADSQAVLTYEFENTVFFQYHLIIYTQRACSNFAVSPPSFTPPPLVCGTSILQNTWLNLSALASPTGSILFTNFIGTYPGTNITQPPITIEVQVCGNLVSQFAFCTIPSVANLVNTTSSTCTPLGDVTTYSWQVNPDTGAGVDLALYHGAVVGTVATLQTRIYFECSDIIQELPFNNTVVYEHYAAAAFSYHFVVQTPYACVSRATTATSSTTTSSSTGATGTSSATTAASTTTGSTSGSSSVTPVIAVLFASLLMLLFV